MTTFDQTYRYERASEVLLDEGRLNLRLATAGGSSPRGQAAHPSFFSGYLAHPEVSAAGLAACALVARTRYYMPPNMVAATIKAADPVVTSNGDRLRFESFSVCGGAYLRYDILPAGLESQPSASGTTNVDLNVPTRQALSGIRGAEPLHLKVGLNDLELTTLDGAVVEKKVPLPQRWLNGFAEVQIAASQMRPHAELTGVEARRFLRSLPASARRPLWVVPAGISLRLTSRPADGAICLTDPSRLKALESLLRFVSSMRLYGPRVDEATESAPSAWELTLPGGRLVIVLSPTLNRGFSGEGAVLNDLSETAVADAADVLSARLAWQPRIDVSVLARDSGLDEPTVVRALTYLSASGRVGFDLADSYFHRELPYDASLIESMHPRLRDARALVDAGAVTLTDTGATVNSLDAHHLVTFTPDGPRCTCPWWGKHRGNRGPCKHVLATTMVST